MKIARSLSEMDRNPRSVVTVGSFDGVHIAHRQIIDDVVRRSVASHGRSVVVTFDPHPSEVVPTKGRVGCLTTLDERIVLIERLSIDLLYVIPFTQQFSQLTSREFYQRYVVDHIGVDEVVVGYDHMFGHNREAGVQELVGIGHELGFRVHSTPAVTIDGLTVSSTEIRAALKAGDVARARTMLGYPYSISGTVVAGDGRGKTLGYPTANIEPLSKKKSVPGQGVYLAGVQLGRDDFYGMMNIGVRPTVMNGGRQTLEVHIFDLDRDIYGSTITVSFLQKLRDERKFSSLEELAVQLAQDKQTSMDQITKHIRRS